MCTVLLPPGGYSIAVKYIISYHRQVGVILHTYPPMKMEQCSETFAYKIQTPGNYPKESIQQQCTSPHCRHCKKYTALRSDFSAVLNWFTLIGQIPILKSFLVSAELFEVNLFISGNSNNNFRWRSTRVFPPLPTNKHVAFIGANRRSARSGCVHN